MKDFKMQHDKFKPNCGYGPAAELKDNIAHLYRGAPLDFYYKGARLTEEYLKEWRKGYTDYCRTKGYTVELTYKEAKSLGNITSDPEEFSTPTKDFRER